LVSDIKGQNRLLVRKWNVEEDVWAKKRVTGKRLENCTLRGFAITLYQILLMRWTGHGARGSRDINREFWWGNLNEGDNL